MTSTRWTLLAALLAMICSLALYRGAYASRSANMGDNFWYVPSAMSLLHEGNLELSEFADDLTPEQRPHLAGRTLLQDLQLRTVDGRTYNFFPAAVAIAIAPAVAVLEGRYAGIPNPLDRSMAIAGFLACALAALAVALMVPLAARLLGSLRAGLGATAVFALCSPHFSAHAGGLWSHNIAALFLIVMLLALTSPSDWLVVVAGIAAGFGCVCRPDFLPFAGVAALYLLLNRRRQLPAFVAGAVAVGSAWLLLSHAMFGTWLPPYFGAGRARTHSLAAAIPGLLVSPNRGLFVFCPWALAAWAAAVACATRRSERRADAWWPYLSVAIAGHFALVMLFPHWWGGHSYGPRFFALAAPALSLLAAHGFHSLRAARREWRPLFAVVAVVCLSFSAAVQFRGAYHASVNKWNAVPSDVDQTPWRIWDWHDLQFLRGL